MGMSSTCSEIRKTSVAELIKLIHKCKIILSFHVERVNSDSLTIRGTYVRPLEV
jgi:hypothetical protein